MCRFEKWYYMSVLVLFKVQQFQLKRENRDGTYWLLKQRKNEDKKFSRVKGIKKETMHCDKRYLKRSSPLENCISGNGKRPCWWRNIFSLAHADILHSSMLDMSSGMEECKITAWAKDNMPLAYAGILHSSMPEMSEESSIFYILCSHTSGGCGLGV